MTELDILGAFVHGALSFGHALGVLYNLRRHNYKQAVIHGVALSYDFWATREHMKQG